MNTEDLITEIIDREGRVFTHDIAGGDPPTKYGITHPPPFINKLPSSNTVKT